MKKLYKIVVAVVMITTILTISVFADGYLQRLDRELSRCDSVEDHGYLVIETSDGYKYAISFDNDAEVFEVMNFDDDGDVIDYECEAYSDSSLGEIVSVNFYH